MLTGTPFVIAKIRAGRKKPGLARQHLTCVQAAAEICGATVTGAKLGSTRLAFAPGPVRPGEYLGGVGFRDIVDIQPATQQLLGGAGTDCREFWSLIGPIKRT